MQINGKKMRCFISISRFERGKYYEWTLQKRKERTKKQGN